MQGWQKPGNGGAIIQSIKETKKKALRQRRKEDNHDKSRNFNGQRFRSASDAESGSDVGEIWDRVRDDDHIRTPHAGCLCGLRDKGGGAGH